MTRLQKNFYTVGIIFMAITLVISIATTVGILSVTPEAIINSVLTDVSIPLFSLVIVIIVRIQGAQSDSIAPESLGLVWFCLCSFLSFGLSYLATIFINRLPGNSISAVLMVRSYAQTIRGFFENAGCILVVAAMGMQIYEKKMTVIEK